MTEEILPSLTDDDTDWLAQLDFGDDTQTWVRIECDRLNHQNCTSYWYGDYDYCNTSLNACVSLLQVVGWNGGPK